MCGARPDGRGMGVTETPLIDFEEAPASAISSACYAVLETSAVQQPVLKVHSKSDAFYT